MNARILPVFLLAAALFASCDQPLSSRPATDQTAPGKAVSGIALSAETAELYARDALALAATVSPADAANREVSWSSDDSAVASVDQGGRVTGLSAGRATIKAKTVDGGFEATCEVLVVPHVYAAGNATVGLVTVPGYWLDGTWIELPTPSGTVYGEVKAIAAADGRLYAGGNYETADGSDYEPAYWVDGAFTELPRLWPGKGGRVLALAVSDGRAYAGGYAVSAADTRIPGYWLDGTWHGLPSSQAPGTGSAVTAIAVSGGKVYAAGIRDSVPGYWVDDAWTPLEAEAKGYVHCLAVDGTVVYAGGESPVGFNTNYSTPCYWRDGVRVDYQVDADYTGFIDSLAVSGGTIYAAGKYNKVNPRTYTPGYWAGGARRTLDPLAAGKAGVADRIAIAGGRVYCFGGCIDADDDWVSGYWLDGAWKPLGLPSGYIEGQVKAVALY